MSDIDPITADDFRELLKSRKLPEPTLASLARAIVNTRTFLVEHRRPGTWEVLWECMLGPTLLGGERKHFAELAAKSNWESPTSLSNALMTAKRVLNRAIRAEFGSHGGQSGGGILSPLLGPFPAPLSSSAMRDNDRRR